MRRLLLLLILTLPAAAFGATVSVHAQAAAVVRLPFAAGTSWKPVQGYNGGTHVPGPERFAFDLVRDGDGPTAGTQVLAPATGTLWYMNAPGTGNGCLSIKIDNGGGLIVEMCHIVALSFRQDQPITVGQPVGTIGVAGTLGNNGLAHLHISMHRTPDLGITRIPAPFAAPEGLPLDGNALPADGSYNQYGCPGASCRGAFVSTNGAAGASPQPAAQPAAASVPAPATAPAPAAPAPSPAAGASVPSGSSTLRAGATVTVSGAGDCMNIHDGPGLAARVLACVPDGTTAVLAQGPLVADGHAWWQLGGLGWGAGDYLTFVSGPALRAGGGVVVDTGDSDCLNLRGGPGAAAPVVLCLPNGAPLTITAGPIDADGTTWWQLDGRGWASGQYLRPRDGY